MFVCVGQQIGQRKAVMCGDEVDGGLRRGLAVILADATEAIIALHRDGGRHREGRFVLGMGGAGNAGEGHQAKQRLGQVLHLKSFH